MAARSRSEWKTASWRSGSRHGRRRRLPLRPTDAPAPRAPMADKEHEIPVKVVDRRWWARADDGTAPEPSAGSKPTYVEDLERQLAEKDRLAQEFIAKYRQAAAEFEESRLRLR